MPIKISTIINSSTFLTQRFFVFLQPPQLLQEIMLSILILLLCIHFFILFRIYGQQKRREEKKYIFTNVPLCICVAAINLCTKIPKGIRYLNSNSHRSFVVSMRYLPHTCLIAIKYIFQQKTYWNNLLNLKFKIFCHFTRLRLTIYPKLSRLCLVTVLAALTAATQIHTYICVHSHENIVNNK